ncbi:MAG: alpha/beta fold hydrolase [Planctomycetaceae bacterium]|jgi:pimeloyl-ACP methyl ester carboxylesterase|nr:alpha/beta fold hydrolase [Planctomycetaceae bacterium]MDG2388576.1 alpha/beta fold hydrolase [Planctomycetaceae bacterium]
MSKRFASLTLLLLCFVIDAAAQDSSSLTLDLLAARNGLPTIKTAGDWEARKAHVLEKMQMVMGPLPKPEVPIPLGLEVLERKQLPFAQRWKVRYHTDDAKFWVHAWLFLPSVQTKTSPAVLCLHQTTKIGKDEPAGLGGKNNLHYAYELAEEGFVTLAPDYPSFGESLDYNFDEDDYVSGTMKAIYDNTRAVDLLQSLPQVNKDQIGCIGHSLGGHNTMFTAAFEPRIKAMVSCCGFTRFHKYYGGNLKGWASSRYMPRISTVYDSNPDRVPFDFPEIIGAFAPRRFLTVSPLHDQNFDVSGVKDSMTAAAAVYGLFNASDHLQAIYPDCEHDFPSDARKVAYEFLRMSLSN